jgi:uncharacterized protein (TIGR00251 family)
VLHARGRRVDLLDAQVARRPSSIRVPLDLGALAISDREDSVRFTVHAKPRARRTEILGVKDGALHVAVAAPPVDGEANAELARGLAEVFGVRARDVAVVAGQSGKRKIVEVRGIDAASARERLLMREG